MPRSLFAPLLFAVASLAVAGSVRAQGVGPVAADVLVRAEVEGTVPVLIRLRADLPRAKGAAAPRIWLRAQEAAVTRAQAPVVADLTARGARVQHTYRSVPYVAARVSAADLRALASDPRVEAVSLDALSRPLAAPSAAASTSTPSDVIAADVAHAAGYTGTGQQIVVLDDGLDHDDARFAGRIATSACFSTNYDFDADEFPGGPDDGPDDEPESFSLCADSANVQVGLGASENGVPRCLIGGTARCVHGNSVAARAERIATGAHFIPIQVYARFEDLPEVCGADACILSYTSDQMAALDYVVTLADSVDGSGDPVFSIAAVNMSIGSGAETGACDGDPRKAVIDNLRALGIATVIASGNGGNRDAGTVPGCISTAITVGIATEDDGIAANADISPVVDFVAPGTASSFTAPVLAAAWAIYRAARPGASVDSVASAFTRSARLIDDQRSGGIATDLPRLQLASALGLLVTTSEDGAGGSIRQNLVDVRGDTTTFADSLSGRTFALPGGALAIDRAAVLDATSLPSGATLNGNSTNRIAEIAAPGDLTLRGLTLADGTAGAGDGGALTNAGTLRLDGVTITGSTATRGGALATTGATVLANVTLSGNTASGAGGGAFHDGGTLFIAGSTIYANGAGSGAAQVQSQSGVLALASVAIGGGPGALADCAALDTLFSGRSHVEDGTCGAAQSGALDLGPLEGAPIATHAPGAGSPLADAGTCDTDSFVGTDLTTDARGLARPVDLASFPNTEDGCDIGAVEAQSEAALPVELTAFTAAQNGDRVMLAWTTASETNNAGFYVEVKETEAVWAERGFVVGFGTTTEAHSYTFELAALPLGTHTVRLRQVNYDGSFAYAPEIELAVTLAEAVRIGRPYPNPAHSAASIEIAVREAQRVQVALYDALGRRVALALDEMVSANETQRVPVLLAGLAGGTYLMRIQGERFAEVRRLTVVR